MFTREDLEEIMNNKPYGAGRRLITKKLKKYRIITHFSTSLKTEPQTEDVVMASSVTEACFPGDDLVNAKQKRKELEEQYPEYWINTKKCAYEIP